MALLEADVALPVVKDFVAAVRDKAVGEEVLRSVTPGQMVVKIVHDHLVETLAQGDAASQLNAVPPVALMMVGLQGSGKTTTAAKLARLLKEREQKKVLLASLDVRAPGGAGAVGRAGEADRRRLPARRGRREAGGDRPARPGTGRREGYDVVILDTAGRLSIDEALMHEVAAVRQAANPAETCWSSMR